jgi:hypothetical protein
MINAKRGADGMTHTGVVLLVASLLLVAVIWVILCVLALVGYWRRSRGKVLDEREEHGWDPGWWGRD